MTKPIWLNWIVELGTYLSLTSGVDLLVGTSRIKSIYGKQHYVMELDSGTMPFKIIAVTLKWLEGQNWETSAASVAQWSEHILCWWWLNILRFETLKQVVAVSSLAFRIDNRKQNNMSDTESVLCDRVGCAVWYSQSDIPVLHFLQWQPGKIWHLSKTGSCGVRLGIQYQQWKAKTPGQILCL